VKINYIQNKKINHECVSNLLNISSKHNQFTNNGPVKALLEKKIESLINCPTNKKVLCVSNGTNALHALIFYYDKINNRKLKWISPSFTFPSCVVNDTNTNLVDIDPLTYTLRPEDVGDADGIIITNLFGTVVNFDIEQFKDKIIIYDNASSFLSNDYYNDGINICLKGNASFGSLHHTKNLGFGEGGFVVVDSDMYDAIQAICGFGFHYERIHNTKSSNFKMSEVSAAYILQHIIDYDIAKHRQIQFNFSKILTNIDGIKLFNNNGSIFYGNLPIIFEKSISANTFRGIGIEANKYYKPLVSNHENSNLLYDTIINFPLHADLNDFDIDYICNAIRRYR